MAIITAIGTAIAGALFAGSALAASLIAGGLAFGVQLAVSYLTRPKARAYSAVQGQVQFGGDVDPVAVYGKAAVAGQRVYYAKYGSGNKFNAEVFVLSNGWCDGLEPEIYFYGEKYALTTRSIIGNEVAHYGVDGFGTRISIRFYDGRPGQLADAKLVTDSASTGNPWQSTSRLSGMCYVVVEREWNADLFEKGRPDFKFVLRGLREYDPRMDSTVAGGSGTQRLSDASTWVWTQNPAVHRLNHQLGLRGLISGRTIIGEGKSLGQLDLGAYFTAMNVCDTGRAGKPTYQCSLIVTAADDHTEVLKEFDDAMAGYGMNRRGLSGVIAGAPQIPVLAITARHIDAERPIEMRRRKSAFDLYNTISGQFTSPEAFWEPASLKPATSNTDRAADGRFRQTSNDFLQVTDPDIAQYLLTIRYRQNRKGGACTLPVSIEAALTVQEGEWVTYDGRTWLITNWRIDEDFRATLTLAETGSDIYEAGGIEPGPIVVSPTPPVNPSLLSTVQNLQVETGMLTGDDGYAFPVLRFTWTPPADPTITAVRLQYRVNTGEEVIFEDVSNDPESGEFTTSKNVVDGRVYAGRATIVTLPDRFKTFTAWTLTEGPTGFTSIRVALSQMPDARNAIGSLARDRDNLRAQIEELAGSTAIGQSEQMAQMSAVARTLKAVAAAYLRLEATVNDSETGLVALAQLVGQVSARVNDATADGLLRIRGIVHEDGDVLAEAVVEMRASLDGETFVQVGTIWQTGFVGGDPEASFGRIVNYADQHIYTNGVDFAPIVTFEDGELKAIAARIGVATVDLLKTPSGKTNFGVLGTGIEGLDISQ